MNKKKKGKTFGEVVREYFPDASNDEIDFILWETTGYPSFWETDDVEACLRKQLREFKASLNEIPTKSKKQIPIKSLKENVESTEQEKAKGGQ